MRDEDGDVTRDMEANSRTDDQPAAARRPTTRKNARESVREQDRDVRETARTPGPESIEADRAEDRISEAEIRERAYELYRLRGAVDGFDQADWLTAEQEIRLRPRREPPGGGSTDG